MKYQWLDENQTCEDLSKELGVKVNSISRGGIVVGHKDGFDMIGNPIQEPVIEQGIEIEFEKEPAAEILEKLDRKLSGLKREGGKDLATELDELKARMGKLESEEATK